MIRIATILTPWYRSARRRTGGGENLPGSTAATRVLDHGSRAIRALVERARLDAHSTEPLDVLRAAHAAIVAAVRPVYSLSDSRPASRVLALGRGSCSQRLAILESVARAIGVPTRVRGLLVDGRFWNPRFPRLRALLPGRMLLAWPEFDVDGRWLSAGELFGPVGCRGGARFANHGSETLFEAAGRCAIDWDGSSGESEFDLSAFVVRDLGRFASRDELFSRAGATMCAPSGWVLEPVLGRIAA